MSTMTGEWSCPLVTPSFDSVEGTAYGDMIDGIRSDCGIIIGAIDWVLRKVGFDLIAAIMDPIAGDFNGVSDIKSGWGNAAGGLQALSTNYASMEAAMPGVWLGEAAEACRANLLGVSEAYAEQSEAATLIGVAIQNMLDATETTVQFVAECLSFIDEIVISLTPAKVAKEILTGGAGIRKCITLAEKAIDWIRKLGDLIPDLIKACTALSAVLKSVNLVLTFAEAGTQAGAGHKADDVAGAV